MILSLKSRSAFDNTFDVRRDFWAQPIRILVFPSPTSDMLLIDLPIFFIDLRYIL